MQAFTDRDMDGAPSDRRIAAWQRFRSYEKSRRKIDHDRDRAFNVTRTQLARARCGHLRPFGVELPPRAWRARCAELLVRWVAAAKQMGHPMLVASQAELAELVDTSERSVRYALGELRHGWLEVVPAFEKCYRGHLECGVCERRGEGHWREVAHGYRPGPRLLAVLAEARARAARRSRTNRVATSANRQSGSTKTGAAGGLGSSRPATSPPENRAQSVSSPPPGDGAASEPAYRRGQRLAKGEGLRVADVLAARLRELEPPPRPVEPPPPYVPPPSDFCSAAVSSLFVGVCKCPRCARGEV